MMKKNLPIQLKEFIKNSNITEISIGCSSSDVYEINKKNDTYYLKIDLKGALSKEALSLSWLKNKLPVADVVFYISEGKHDYLLTTAVSGEMSCSDYWWDYPEIVIPAVAEAIKMIQAVNTSACPLRSNLDYKLELVKNNIDNNLIDFNKFKSPIDVKFNNYNEVYSFLIKNKIKEDLCFSHGDTSLPNIFIKDEKVSGFIDLGECGIADKWFDIAITVKSIRRNYEDKKYVDLFFECLGIKPDYEKINYYHLLMMLYL